LGLHFTAAVKKFRRKQTKQKKSVWISKTRP
jgi:hypothetical protein